MRCPPLPGPASAFLCTIRTAAPGATGLYDPANEHDACGIALVAKLWGDATHAVVEKALDALENLEHRGAEGADPNTGDGAGILLQMPDAFLRAAAAGVELPPPGRYGVGVCYLPTDAERRVRDRAADRGDDRGRGPARRSGGATFPSTTATSARPRGCAAPVIRQVLIERRRGASRTRTRSSASCT